ncbi:hypothetical protein IT072_21080 (plasmid) [Leifsonia sp. ZF2019]|uniref:hypothetical protein n=1 Tax=Leifsonia sp. ZF2019 TaxID=2781978 RepID=UPI001CC04D33|nr:hypothetical protein [Leifsonia sp. ZF2019]UAJ81748.1 hypothetical protein IT072_21080 [Leifsonia sp. ZF2019]
MITVIARGDGVHMGDMLNLVETWDFFDSARLGELALRFTKASFRPTINGTHAWLLRIVHDAEAVQSPEGWWEWKSTGEEQDYVYLFNMLGRTRNTSWQISDASRWRLSHSASLAETIRPGATGQRMVQLEYLSGARLVSLPDFRDQVRLSDARLHAHQVKEQRKRQNP